MAQTLAVTGVVRPRRTGASIAGYGIHLALGGETTVGGQVLRHPVHGSARLPGDGSFDLRIDVDGDPVGPGVLSVSAPAGVEVLRQELSLEQLAKPLRLRVGTVDPVPVEPSDDPTLGARVRITGQVIDRSGRTVPVGLPVVIAGVQPAGSDTPLVVATTGSSGRFGADWVATILTSAAGTVAGVAEQPVPLDPDGRLPRSIVLVVDVDRLPGGDHDGEDDCGCSDAPSPARAPDQADLTTDPEGFSQDLGAGCVELTMPNRVLEEFAYFQVVRTSEPRVTGLTLGVRRTVPPELLTDLLGVSIAAQALGFARATTVSVPATTLSLDVSAARSLVRSDRPPAVADIARASWLSEVSATKDLIDAGLRTATERAMLDADSPIDWDDTPTVYLALDLAFGHLLQFREIWRADGYSLGDLLYSLPLAPGQRRQVAVLDWDRRTSSAREERLEFEEHLDALLSRDRDVQELVGSDLHEQVAGGSRNSTWGVAGGLGAGFIGTGFGIFGGVAGGASGSSSSSWQDSARTFAADSMQQLRDRVSQRSSALRSERSSVVQSVSQGETLRAETESVGNYNRCHALTIEYFEVLRHFQVTHELADARECVFVPFPLTQFDRAKALRWREVLSRFLRRPELSGGFAAIERIADNWVGWDYPVSRYSEEPPVSIEGELRVSFLLPRPRDAADGTFQVDMWAPLAPFLNTDPLELFTARLNDLTARERDREFRTQVAPGIAERMVQGLRLAFVGPDGGETEVPLDATLISRYAESTPLYVTLNQAGGVPGVPRDDIAHVKIWYDGPQLPPDARVIVHTGRLRYSTDHLTAMLFDENRILDDLAVGDAVVLATPLSQRELRNPRQEDIELADRLVTHLNDRLEFFHQAIWATLDAQRRFMLLDSIEVPGLGGRSVASLCSNQLIGIVGNSLVLPVAPGLRLDPTLTAPDGKEAPIALTHAYAAPPSPPLRVSVPTRGVYAEAVAGSCNSCETIDDTRFWRWTTDGQLAPPSIEPVSTVTRATEEPDLTPTPLPAPLVQIQNAPAVPDPVGLGAAFQLLSRPDLFRDITGLEGTQRNAAAAFQASLSAASALGDEAAKLASQQELGRNAERMVDRIDKARADGLLSQTQAKALTRSALEGLLGEPRPAAQSPTTDPVVDAVIDQAAQGTKSDITVSSPSETVAVSFDDDRPVVGGAAVASAPLELVEQVRQPVLLEVPETGSMTPFVLDTYDLLSTLIGPRLAAAEAAGLVTKDPADQTKFTVQRRLRIVHPAGVLTPRKVAGSGRLPVVAIVHGQHRATGPTGTPHPNLDGYAALQDELARQGIVSVSVDTNAANIVNSLIDMRAQMVLGALDALRAMDADPSSRLHERLDLDRVALVGHSRGGDAVVRAARMNASRPAATKFGLRAVCSLAPTDFGFGSQPGPTELTSTDTGFYAVVYGALDGDVAGQGGARAFGGTGFRHYDRARCEKAMVFLDGCSHNRFNSVWAADGDESGVVAADRAPGGRLLPVADHATLLDEYVGGLCRWRLLGDTAPRTLFDGTGTNSLKAGASLQWSFGGQIEPLDDMENPTKPRTLTGAFIDPFPDVLVDASQPTKTLELETDHVTTVLALEPPLISGEAYVISLAPGQSDWTQFSALAINVSGHFDLTDQASITAGQLPEFSVVLTDASGASVAIGSTTFATAQAPSRPVFHQHSSGENCTVLRLETMALPISSIPTVDPSRIALVGLMAGPGMQRHVFLDSLQLVRF